MQEKLQLSIYQMISETDNIYLRFHSCIAITDFQGLVEKPAKKEILSVYLQTRQNITVAEALSHSKNYCVFFHQMLS